MFRLVTSRMGALHSDSAWNNRVHTARWKRYRRAGAKQRPVGPKLIVGRGVARRRAPVTWCRWLVYALIAGAILITITGL